MFAETCIERKGVKWGGKGSGKAVRKIDLINIACRDVFLSPADQFAKQSLIEIVGETNRLIGKRNLRIEWSSKGREAA